MHFGSSLMQFIVSVPQFIPKLLNPGTIQYNIEQLTGHGIFMRLSRAVPARIRVLRTHFFQRHIENRITIYYMERKMKKTIMFVMISVVLALASCSPPEEETVTALSDHALISSQETEELKTEQESTLTQLTEAESTAASEEGFHESPGGIRAEGSPAKLPESAEPSGEEYVSYPEDTPSYGGGTYDPVPQT